VHEREDIDEDMGTMNNLDDIIYDTC